MQSGRLSGLPHSAASEFAEEVLCRRCGWEGKIHFPGIFDGRRVSLARMGTWAGSWSGLRNSIRAELLPLHGVGQPKMECFDRGCRCIAYGREQGNRDRSE